MSDRDVEMDDLRDTGSPYLFVDLYHHDRGAHPPWDVVAETPHFVGAIIKAMEGTRYGDDGWFQDNWPAVLEAGGDRYGTTWFRGAYLFLRFSKGGADQAGAYLQVVEDAGGWGPGDILPIIDVELGSDTNPNRRAGAEQVIACVTECADEIRSQTGRRVMLYGRGAMRDLSITSRMGCDIVWNPSYTTKMVTHGLEAWELDDIALWQYCGGDDTAKARNLPHEVPDFGKVDISVYVEGARRPTLQSLRQRLLDPR